MLKLYGIPASQPVRAVMWFMTWKQIPFEIISTMPGSKDTGGSRHETFLEKFPPGTVPGLYDPEADLYLWESNAILCYLADKHKAHDLYSQDLAVRARVNQWLHWHHGNTRQFTLTYFAPVMRPDLKIPPEQVESSKRKLNKILDQLAKQLDKTPFLAGENVSIADLACYVDLGQLNSKNLELVDFGSHPSVSSWMQRMETLPGYAESHKVIPKLKKFFAKSSNM